MGKHLCLLVLLLSTAISGVHAQNYTISTLGNNIIITDVSGNSDELVTTQSGGNINFATVAARTYSLNGGATTAFPVAIPLAGITSITINGEAGNDVMNMGAFTAALPNLTINGGTGGDLVLFNGDISFAANASLDVDLQNDNATPGVDRVTLAANVNLLFSGTGGATIRVSRDVQLNTGSSIETTNGNLIVEANQQLIPTSAGFVGVDIIGGLLQTSGTGSLTVRGKGGNTGDYQHGIHLRSSGKILGGTAGLITVQGTGGISSGSYNYGVYVEGANAAINSSGGNVTVTGQGGGSGSSVNNLGVFVQNGGLIAAGGSGTVSVQGMGGLSNGNFNAGIFVSGINAAINSAGGNVSVTGIGGGSGTSSNNVGVYVSTAAIISAGSNGAVAVQGTGGTTGGFDYGVYVSGSNAAITSSGGNVTVTGNGGGSGIGGTNYGVFVESSADITAGGLGSVSVVGTSSATAGSFFNHGVYLTGANTTITSAGGAVTVFGQAGGSASSGSNYGVYVQSAAVISAGGTGAVNVQGTGGLLSTSSNNIGLFVTGAASRITSTGGNVSVTGQGGGTGSGGVNIGLLVNNAGNISAGGSGTANVAGTGGATSGHFNVGVHVDQTSTTINSTGGNITVTGQGGGSGISAFNFGVLVQNSAVVSAGGSGLVLVMGTGGTNSTGENNAGVGVHTANATITSNSGNVTIIGQGGGLGSSPYNYGVWVQSSGVITSGGTGIVSVQGTGGASGGGFNYGLFMNGANSRITSSGGNVSVNGQGGGSGSSINNHGVFIQAAAFISAGLNGTVNVEGTGGATTGNFNAGVFVSDANSRITSSGGNVSVIGQGGGSVSSSNNVGVYILSGAVVSAGLNGTVFVQGSGGTTGGFGYGVYLGGANTAITSSGGNVTVTGIEGGGPSGLGLAITTSSAITTATNGGNILLIANSMDIENTASVTTNPASSVSIHPYDNNVQIDLGTALNPIGGPLGLSDAELDRITTGNLIIGDANTGAITVSAAITRPAATNMQLNSNSDINLSGGGINTAGGTLLLNPGEPSTATRPTFTGTDVAASTTTLVAGSDLAIIINGATPGSGYNQLTVVGMVNISGVNLILSGTHAPMSGQIFIIVDNDAADPVIGTFTGLPEGAVISNFLGSSLSATITYVGGTGNDVVLTVCPLPTITCPATQTLVLGSECSASLPDYTSLATTGGGCGMVSVTQSPLPGTTVSDAGDITVTLTVTDLSGNDVLCTFTVTKVDNTSPTITCPETQTLILGAECSASLPNYTELTTTDDNCGVANVTQSPLPGTIVSGAGDMTVTLTVTDINGNSTEPCSFTVTKVDNTPPTITCPETQTLILGAECSASLPNYTDVSTDDNCEVQSITQSPLPETTVFGAGEMTVTLTVTDVNGNTAECSFTVIKVDNSEPTVECFNHTVTFNGENTIFLNAEDLVSVSDECGEVSIELSPSSISCEQLGQVVPVTVTVTDINGNQSTCTSQVTVNGLPCGFSQEPDGVNCVNGNSVAYNPTTGVWTATSTNCYYTSPYTTDQMAFAQRTLCGNGSITAQVTSISGTALGWAGVMMRESNDAGAKKAQLMTNLSNFSRREFRTTTNGQAFPQQFPTLNRYWLRLVRAGNQFSMYVSPNGQNWFFVGVQNISMNACIQIGLVVTNSKPVSTVTATFANVSFTGDGGMPPSETLASPAISQQAKAMPGFELFPNPTSGELNVDLMQYAGRAVRIEVYSATGQLLQFVEVDEAQTMLERMDLSTFQNGMYFVKVKSQGLPDATKRVVLHGSR